MQECIKVHAYFILVTSISGNDACVVPSGGLAYKIICGVPGGGGGGASPAPGIVCPVSSPGSRSLTTNGAVTTSSVSSTTGEISASSTKSNTTPSTLNGASTDNQRQAASVIGVAGLAAMLL